MEKKHIFLKQQRGSALLEAMIAILIFSMGIIALMGLQGVSIKNSIDAKYRADAAYLANQIIGQMWVDRARIAEYAHHKDAGGGVCQPAGNASTRGQPMDDWLAQIAATLPGGASSAQQITVTPIADTQQVQVTICWKGPQETVTHNFVATAQINTL